jgi:hypothetical protein
MPKRLQGALLIGGIVILVILLTDIGVAVVATTHGSTPAKIVRVQARPYSLTVSLYRDPANAGYALPFIITSTQPLTYMVTSLPDSGVDATAVRASIGPDATNPNGVEGVAEITVQGRWQLHIVATGPEGQGSTNVPFTATVLPILPVWLGWPLGSIPLVGLFFFLFMQARRWKQLMADQQTAEKFHSA